MLVGLISDTHGLLRPQALDALRGCERIVHAGDVGRPEVIAALQGLAPVTVVRGNNDDPDAWPDTDTLEVQGKRLLVLHDIAKLGKTPPDIDVVIFGHSHKPRCEWRGEVLFINTGSAGPRRFALPVSLARLHMREGGAVEPEFVTLPV